MTTSQTSTLSEKLMETPISVGTLAYFRERLRIGLHEMVFLEFRKQERDGRLTKAELARRLGKRPEQITRWLGAPGNWTLDTVSDLLLGMGSEPTFKVVPLVEGERMVRAAVVQLRTQRSQGSESAQTVRQPPTRRDPIVLVREVIPQRQPQTQRDAHPQTAVA